MNEPQIRISLDEAKKIIDFYIKNDGYRDPICTEMIKAVVREDRLYGQGGLRWIEKWDEEHGAIGGKWNRGL